MILYSQALTLSGSYVDFGKLAVTVLSMVADIRHVTLSDGDLQAFIEMLRDLPAHPDERLRDAGFRMVTLTNSAPGHGRSPLEHAGLSAYRMITACCPSRPVADDTTGPT